MDKCNPTSKPHTYPNSHHKKRVTLLTAVLRGDIIGGRESREKYDFALSYVTGSEEMTLFLL